MAALRKWTGIILFAFAATHLMNHALGLVSLEAMESARDWRIAVTRSLPGTLIIAAALVVHITLGIEKFTRRRAWRMTRHELVQLTFGLLIPLLLLQHMIGMRAAHELFGVNDNYTHALFVMWPDFAVRQLVLITLVWVHGVIGIHHLLHLQDWYLRVRGIAFGLAVLVPVLAFAGFAVAAREVRLATEWHSPLTNAQYDQLVSIINASWWGYVAVLGAVVALHVLIAAGRRFKPAIRVTYPGDVEVPAVPGLSLLEVSRLNNIPHASVCGGRARCSTCRVRVLKGLEDQPPPDQLEQAVLDRVGATSNVRLACQLRPAANLRVVPLLPASRVSDATVSRLDKYFWGVEHEVTLLFADIRGFTKLSEQHLPYDVVFLLNQYLASMSQAITDAGGYIDKFMGDGLMAIFGMDRPAAHGARDAIAAARAMSGVLDALNQSLRDQIGEPFRIGIGIHTGIAILGRIGVASGTGAGERITALGDTVNAASRLENASKELSAELVISAHSLQLAGYDIEALDLDDIAIRGRQAQLPVLALKRALHLDLPGDGPGSARQGQASRR